MMKFGLLIGLFAALGLAEERGPLNEHLPTWVTLGVQTRFRSEGQHGIGFTEGNDQDFLLERYRFALTLKPTSWLQFYGEMQDSRSRWAPHPDASLRDTLDLRQAYVMVGKESGWWDIKGGRQKLAFGSERLLGGAEWSNVPRVYDGVRLALHHGTNRLDMFASSVVQADTDAWDHHKEGNNLYGAYASLGSVVKNAKFEPYYLYRVAPGNSNSNTMGVRLAGSVDKVWTYETELIAQRGSIANTPLKAWAYLGQINRRISALPWNTTLAGEFNFASGDRRQNDGQNNTFDQLYPTNHLIYGTTDQQGRRNAENFRTGVKVQPRKWLTVRMEERWLLLASKYDALYAFNGAVSIKAVNGGAVSRYVGNETSIIGDVALSRYYDIGAQYGHLNAGKFVTTYSPGSGRGFYSFFVNFHL